MFLGAANGHAGVNRLDHARGADGIQLIHQGVGDLHRQPLLHLRPTCVTFHQTRQLAQSHDFSVGQIRHMRPAGERQQMMLTQRMKFDVAQQHNFVISLAKNGPQMPLWIIVQPGHQFGIGTRDAIGRAQQSLAIRIFADGEQNLAHGFFDARKINGRVSQVIGAGCVFAIMSAGNGAGKGHSNLQSARPCSATMRASRQGPL